MDPSMREKTAAAAAAAKLMTNGSLNLTLYAATMTAADTPQTDNNNMNANLYGLVFTL